MTQYTIIRNLHDVGPNPCGGPMYDTVATSFGWGAPSTMFFDGHVPLDGKERKYMDPLPCATCGADVGVKYAPPSSGFDAATAERLGF